MKTILLTECVAAIQRAAMLLSLLVTAQGCGGDTPVLITLTGDVAGVEGFQVTPSLNGRVGDVRHLDGTQRQLILWIPSGQRRSLHLDAVVISSHLASCTRGHSTADVIVEPEFTMPIQVTLDLSLVLLPTKLCTLLSKITPPIGPMDKGITLELEGQNLTEGTTVTVAGVAASEVTITAQGRLTAMLPAVHAAFGKVAVVVRTPDGQIASRSDLFAYYASQLAFPVTTFDAGMDSSSVAVGDFNGDQQPDLVVVNHSPSSRYVSVLMGNGLGGFGPATSFVSDYGPEAVAVGDFNGDQKLDLAVANLSARNVSVLLGNGIGGFNAATNFPVGSYATSVAVGDFNGDWKLDLVVGTDGGPVSVLLGNGMGGFDSTNTFPAGTNPRSVAVGDFNGDLKLDFAAANYGSNSVSVRLGNGDGNFDFKPPPYDSPPAGTKPQSVSVGDFNGDQKLDLVVANDYSNNVNVLLGDGMGGFGTPTSFAAGTNPYSVAVGDFNGDQKLDLAVVSGLGDKVSVLLGNGLGSFGAANNFPVGRIFYPSVAVGDFNGDQKPDIAVTTGAGVALLTNLSQ